MQTDNFLHQPPQNLNPNSSSLQTTQSVFGQHSQPEQQETTKFRRNQGDFSRNKSKLFLGGLVLSLFMVAGGVAYHLSQQAGIGEIRQQASVGSEGWIAFSAKTATGTTQIFSMKEDNGDFKVLSSEINGESSKHVSYSPDGSKAVYTSNKSGSWNIYMMDSDGGNEEQLTTDGGAFYPSFSPDGSKVVYVFETSIGPAISSQIRVKNIGGSITPLTDAVQAKIHNPLLIQGGSKLIFSSTQMGGIPQIFSYNLGVENSPINQLTTSGGKHPSMLNNNTIMFVAPIDGVDQIFSIGIDGGNLTQLTFDTTSHYGYPVISPDGTHIAYVAWNIGEILPTVAPTTPPTVAPTAIPTVAPTPTDVPWCLARGEECYNGYSEGTCCSGLFCSYDTDNCECIDSNNCPALPTTTPTVAPTAIPTTAPTLTPVPHLTIAPTIPEGSCTGQCLGSPGFECPGGSFVCSPDGLGSCSWTCGQGDVMGVNTADYQIVIENLNTGEAWEFSQPHLWQDEYVNSDETMLSPNSWVINSQTPTISPGLSPTGQPEELSCGEFGCISNNDCEGDLTCAVFGDNERGYCSEQVNLDACLAEPSLETCCDEPAILTPDPTSALTPTVVPETSPTPGISEPEGSVDLTLSISLDGVPYCENIGTTCLGNSDCQENNFCILGNCSACYHPISSHPAFSGGQRIINTNVTILHAKAGIFTKNNVEFVYSEQSRAFSNSSPVTFDNLPEGPFMIYVKGPMHMATQYCYSGAGINNVCNYESLLAANNIYPTVTPHFIYLIHGANSLDLSARSVRVGDLPISGEAQNVQDGKVNVFDYSFMLSCLGNNSKTEFCLSRADVDFSGQVNNIDLGLLRKAFIETVDQI